MCKNIISFYYMNNNKYKTKLAVVITSGYAKRLPYLVDVLYSLNNQTVQGFNVVLVDDTVDGKAFDHLVAWMAHTKKMPTIQYQQKNLKYAKEKGVFDLLDRPDAEPLYFNLRLLKSGGVGCSKACNTGIKWVLENLQPEYIAMHDDDDMSIYTRLELQIRALDEAKSKGVPVSACGSDKLEFGIRHCGRQRKANTPPDDPNITEELRQQLLANSFINLQSQALFFGSAVFKPCVMMTAEAARTAFDDSFVHIGDDIIMNSRLAQAGKIIYIPLPLVYYRRHDTNVTAAVGADFSKGYTRAIKQCIRETAGVEVSDEFAMRYYLTYHKNEYSTGLDEFADETLAVLSKCTTACKESIEFLIRTTVKDIQHNHTQAIAQKAGINA